MEHSSSSQIDPSLAREGISPGASREGARATSVRSCVAASGNEQTNEPAPASVPNRPPARWAGRPLAGFPATSGAVWGFPAGLRAGSVRDARKAGGRAPTKDAKFAGTLAGATGLEPATSGVTGDARGNTILHAKTRKSTISREFVACGGRAFHGHPLGFRALPPHPGPIELSLALVTGDRTYCTVVVYLVHSESGRDLFVRCRANEGPG